MTRSRAVRVLSWAVSAHVLLAAHCQPHDVELADFSGLDGGDASVTGKPCGNTAECDNGEFCDKGCSEPFGRCSRMPVFCAGDLDPVCGCDQITYFSDCFRRMNGVGLVARGECAQGRACAGPGDAACGTSGAKCARLLQTGPNCGPNVTGTCWFIPDVCPPPVQGVGPVGGGWEECRGPGPGPGPLKCAGLCDAIRSERAFHRSPPNECH
ncbi:MAG: hypothetical protein U0174_09105 [Polyangiaceae bacterium]